MVVRLAPQESMVRIDNRVPPDLSRVIRFSSLVSVAVLLCWSLGVARPGWAHGILVDSRPSVGETVPAVSGLDLRFNVRIEPAFSRVSLTGPSGEHMPLRAMPYRAAAPNRLEAVAPALRPGRYTVHWKVLTVDGHISEGTFPFRIRPES
jgi:methionine-rich copper-binding protein CopC